jgi:hypothetical protein
LDEIFYRGKTGKSQNTVDPGGFFDSFHIPRSGKDGRANPTIEGLKNSSEKRLTKRGDALRCTPATEGSKRSETTGLNKSKDLVDPREKDGKLFAPQRKAANGRKRWR